AAHNLGGGVAFVQVKAAGQCSDRGRMAICAESSQYELTGVPRDRGDRKIRDVAVWDSHCFLQQIGEGAQTSSQDDTRRGAQGRGVTDEISSALHGLQPVSRCGAAESDFCRPRTL